MFFSNSKRYKSINPHNKQGLYLLDLLRSNTKLDAQESFANTARVENILSDAFNLVVNKNDFKSQLQILIDEKSPKNACIYLN